MVMGMSSGYSGMVGNQKEQLKVEAKYPALLFKQHLTAYVEKIYGLIRDNIKKEISPFLNLCIQVKTYKSTDLQKHNVSKKRLLHLQYNCQLPPTGTKTNES